MLQLLLLLPVAVSQAVSPVGDPREIVRAARLAVEGDSVTAVTGVWRARLARDSTDNSATLGVATVARLTYDSAAASTAYARLLVRHASPRFVAYATLGMGELFMFRAPLDTAAAWLERAVGAAQSASDSAAEAEALLELSLVRSRLSAPVPALALVDRASHLVAADDAELQARLHCRRAGVLVILDKPATVSEARLGLEVARRAHEPAMEAFCYDMLGWYFSVHDGDETVPFDSAIAVTRRAHDRFGLALAHWWRASAYVEAYDHSAGQREFSAAVEEARASGNRFVEGWAWARLAIVSSDFSDFKTANDRLQRAKLQLRRQGDGWGVAYARREQGNNALAAGQLDSAESAMRDDLSWATMTGQDAEQLWARMSLAHVTLRRGEWARAARENDAVRQFSVAHGITSWLGQIQYDHALVALRRHDLREAERAFVAIVADTMRSALTRYSARLRLSEAFFAADSLGRAEHELTLAADDLDGLRKSLDDRSLRVMAFQFRKSSEDAEQGFASIIAGLAASGRVDAAFTLAERRRARELGDALVRAGRLEAARLTTPRNGADLEGLVASVSLPTGGNDLALLEFVVGRGIEPTTLFVLTHAARTAYRLPNVESLAADITAFGDRLESGADARTLGRRLGDALLARAIGELPPSVTQLVVVPDGPLHRLPFDALVMSDGRFVVERFVVSTAPSAAVAAALRTRAAARPAEDARLLAFGDPAFAHVRPASTGRVADTYGDAFAASGGLARLPASADEAKLVARYAPHASVRLGDKASESFLKRSPLDSFTVLHFATHAVVDEDSQMRTALAVAPGEGEDGFLGAEEIAALHLDADLVVLSACRTARGVVIGGEGVQGLAAPLVQAGARSVIASQWRVGDVATERFMDLFYGQLAAALPLGAALRQAKLATMRNGAPASVWAAFTIVGDPLARIAMRRPTRGSAWVLAAAALALLAAAFVVGRQRSRRRLRRP